MNAQKFRLLTFFYLKLLLFIIFPLNFNIWNDISGMASPLFKNRDVIIIPVRQLAGLCDVINLMAVSGGEL